MFKKIFAITIRDRPSRSVATMIP